MYLRSLLTLLLAAALPTAVFAKKGNSDSTYVLDFPGTITARIFIGEKISTFRISDGARSENLQFRPNNTLTIGVGVTIRGIGLNFSTRLPFHDYKEDLYGRTRRLDLQIHR